DHHHPIAQAFATGKKTSGDRKVRGVKGATADRFFLLCSSIHRPQKGVRATAVWLMGTSRWAKTIEASRQFGVTQSLDELYECIVEQALQLGFERARLYRWDPVEEQLFGVTSRGYSAAKAGKLVGFPVGVEPFSKITIFQKRSRLYVANSPDEHET